MNDLITSVLCKKTFRQGGTNVYGFFEEGKFYNKFIVEEEDIYGENIPYTYKYIYIFSEHGGHRFHLDKKNTSDTSKTYFLNFYDYFYDNRELRKLKLKKISQVNEK